jgi:hypothetical protein
VPAKELTFNKNKPAINMNWGNVGIIRILSLLAGLKVHILPELVLTVNAKIDQANQTDLL